MKELYAMTITTADHEIIFNATGITVDIVNKVLEKYPNYHKIDIWRYVPADKEDCDLKEGDYDEQT